MNYPRTVNSERSERFKGEFRLKVRCAAEENPADRESLLKEAVLEAVRTDHLLALRNFVEEFGAGVEVVDPRNRTALSLAAERGNVDVVGYLLSKNVSTESLDNFGRTALYWAARWGQLDVVKLLAEHGATPTDFAVEVGALYGREEITKYLREYAERSSSA